MPVGWRTLQFICLYLGLPMAIIQHTESACAGPQAGMWHHMLALPCRGGAPLVVNEGGDEGAFVIWLQFGPLHLWNTPMHTQACPRTCVFASFISTLILGWRPPASSWILISIWWMWRGPQGVGSGVTTYTLCTQPHKRTHYKKSTAGHGSVNYGLQKPSSVLTLDCCCLCPAAPAWQMQSWCLQSLVCLLAHYFVNDKENWADRAAFHCLALLFKSFQFGPLSSCASCDLTVCYFPQSK